MKSIMDIDSETYFKNKAKMNRSMSGQMTLFDLIEDSKNEENKKWLKYAAAYIPGCDDQQEIEDVLVYLIKKEDGERKLLWEKSIQLDGLMKEKNESNSN